MLISPASTLRLCGAFLLLLLTSGCDLAAIGDDSLTVRVTVQDVNTGEPLSAARVGVGYDQLGLSVDWIETTNADANGQAVFEVAECERSSLLVNAFGATANGGSYGPSKEYIPCEPGEASVTLELAQY
ncbi:MAG: hypothetical protein AAF170_04755 [Bacteroidota bacterium]